MSNIKLDDPELKLLQQVRILITLVILGLVLSGVTAFPLETEIGWLDRQLSNIEAFPDLRRWIHNVYVGVHETNEKYPFISYGSDWLAFAHLVIAVAFIGPLRDPVKNIWVIEFGIIASLLIFPLAFIAGPIRGIPVFWRLIDCSFGVIGGALLLWARGRIKLLEMMSSRH